MAKQASKACLSLFIVLLLLANYSVSAKPSDKSYAPTVSESENKSISPESLPVLPDPDSQTTEAEAVDEILSPTYFSVPPSANIPEVETKSDEKLSQENVSILSNVGEPSDLQIENGEESLSQELAVPRASNIVPSLETIGDEYTNTSPSNVDNSARDVQEMDNFSQENALDPPSMVDSPAVETKESTEDLFQENTSLPPSNADNTVLDIREMENFSQEDTSDPPSMADLPAVETKESTEDLLQENTSLSPSNVDNSALDIQEMDNFSQENTSDPPSMEDSPAVETKESTDDFFQENTSEPPSVEDSPAVETKESTEDFFQDNTSEPPSVEDSPAVETKESTEDFFQENTSLPPLPSSEVPAVETSDDGSESFTQDNQFPSTDVDDPAPETKADQQDITTEDYSSGTPPNTESQNPENVAELNDYSSIPTTANPAPSEAFSFPESDPTIQTIPSDDDTFGLASTSGHTVLPSNYRAEDEPVEPYEGEEDSWNRGSGAVAGVLVGASVIGVGGFVYQKRQKDRAQYQSLAKKGGV